MGGYVQRWEDAAGGYPKKERVCFGGRVLGATTICFVLFGLQPIQSPNPYHCTVLNPWLWALARADGPNFGSGRQLVGWGLGRIRLANRRAAAAQAALQCASELGQLPSELGRHATQSAGQQFRSQKIW